LIHSKC